jgi:hypothetical protein
MKIYIPTKGRGPELQHTYRALYAADVQYEYTLLVETDEERLVMNKAGLRCEASGASGIMGARQWVMDNGPWKVLMLDDDLSSWASLSEGGKYLKDERSPVRAIAVIDDLLTTNVHAAIGHRQFANGKPLVEYNSRMLRALGYRTDMVKSHGIRYELPLMEDFEMTLKLLTIGYKNAIYYGVVQDQAKSGAPGGCSELRTLELHNACAERLAEMFPKYVKVREVPGWDLGVRKDVSVQWKRAYRDGQ